MDDPLILAIQERNTDRLTELLERSANPNAVRTDGPRWTALHEAIEQWDDGGTGEAFVLLLRHGADVEGRGWPGDSPLLVALFRGLREAAQMLLAKGADVNREGDEGDSPLRFCVEKRDYAMAALLLRCGARSTIDRWGGPTGMSALGRAAYEVDPPMVRLLLAAGADPKAIDGDRLTALERMRLRDRRDESASAEIERLLTEHGEAHEGP